MKPRRGQYVKRRNLRLVAASIPSGSVFAARGIQKKAPAPAGAGALSMGDLTLPVQAGENRCRGCSQCLRFRRR